MFQESTHTHRMQIRVSTGEYETTLRTRDKSTGILSTVAVSSRFSADLYTDWGSVLYRHRCAHLTQKVATPQGKLCKEAAFQKKTKQVGYHQRETPRSFQREAKPQLLQREVTGAGIERKWKYTLRAFQPRREAPE